MHILATGGAGYIGSHTLIELISDGHTVTVADNLSNSSIEAVRRVEKITNSTIPFYQVDVTNYEALNNLFSKQNIDAVIHFAGLKSVNESIEQPLKYYKNNVDSTLVLLEVMKKYQVKKLVFSSSATVYGTPEYLPLRESARTGTGITNPYGQTKFMIEQILQDMSVADESLQITILRYFNPVGAHASGLIGEDPNGVPNNLLPYVSQVAIGRLETVSIFGDDYDTIDGTGVRDYIHVVDLARGHVAALNELRPGTEIYNLCTGTGVSVLQLIEAFSVASGKKIPYIIAPRRPGDIASCYATPEKANANLNWYAEKTIEQACEDSWRWQSLNPSGYNQAA